MNYKALARKCRPQLFKDVVGQQHVIMAIANSINLSRIHHSYLLSGIRGVGKTTIARLFAKSLSCVDGITVAPCRKCKNCIEIEKKCFVDVIEIDAASHTKVEEIRDLLDETQYAPIVGRFKIYIIDEVHMLSKHSFNALLKVLEEPFDYIKFILVTTEHFKLPITILSRCLQLHLRSLDQSQIVSYLVDILKKENIEFEYGAIQFLSRFANGSIRDALTLVEQAIILGNNKVSMDSVRYMYGISHINQSIIIIKALVSANGALLMKEITKCAKSGVDWEFLLIDMLYVLHKLVLFQMVPSLYNSEILGNHQTVEYLIKKCSSADLQLFYRILLNGLKELSSILSYRMSIEMMFLRVLIFYTRKYEESTNDSSIKNNIDDNSFILNHNDTNVNINLDFNDCDILKGTKKKINYDKSHFINPSDRLDSLNIDSSYILQETTDLLNAHSTLLEYKKQQYNKKSNISNHNEYSSNILERFSNVSKLMQHKYANISHQKYNERLCNTYQGLSVDTLKLQYAFNIKLLPVLMREAMLRDFWSYQISRLSLSLPGKQLAIHSWKQDISSTEIYLYLRLQYSYLNSMIAQNNLSLSMKKIFNINIKFFVEDIANLSIRTPIEWCNFIYEEKLLIDKTIKNK